MQLMSTHTVAAPQEMHVLLIEDNAGDARLVKEALSQEPWEGGTFKLQWADRLQPGLDYLDKQHIDLILLDLSLPDTHGLTTMKRVQAYAPDIPIVVLTGAKDAGTALQALKMGAQDYLVKGEIEGKALTRTMRYALERARFRVELRRSEERYRNLFEKADVIFCTLDPAGTFTSINAKGEELLGYSAPELLGTDIRLLAPSESKEQIQAALNLKKGLQPLPVEIQLRNKRGEFLPLEFSAHSASEDQQGAVLCILRDIRERKQLQSQLRHALKMEALGRLAGGVAHDFNNLLMVISGYADIHLAELPKGSPARQHILPIIKAADRAASLTRQLLTFSRKEEATPAILDAGQIIRDYTKMLRRLIPENIQLKIQIDPDAGRVKADPTQFEQILMNLAINARDAMPSGGSLTISASNASVYERRAEGQIQTPPGEYVMLTIADTGVGMSRETRERIFEPFFTTKSSGTGTGLGLAMVYGIVKQSGGDIWLSSEERRGTTFKVFLPRIFEQADSKDAATLETPRRGTETVLVVEDDQNLRWMIETVLSGWGYSVLTASDAQDALKISRERSQNIDLVVTDLVLPGMSGEEFAAQIRELRPETKCLYMSGYPAGMTGMTTTNVELGNTPYLQKPFVPSQLSEKLRLIFEKE